MAGQSKHLRLENSTFDSRHLWLKLNPYKTHTMANFIAHFVTILEKAKDQSPIRRDVTFPNYLGSEPANFLKKSEDTLNMSENFINTEMELEGLSDKLFYKPFGDPTSKTRHAQEGRKLFKLLAECIRDLIAKLESKDWLKNPPVIDPYTWITLPDTVPDTHTDFEIYTKILLCLDVALTLVHRPEYLGYTRHCICTADEDHFLIHVKHSSARDYGRRIVLNTIMWDRSYTTLSAIFKNSCGSFVFDLNNSTNDISCSTSSTTDISCCSLDVSDVETQPGSPQTDDSQKIPGLPDKPFIARLTITNDAKPESLESPESPEID
jgi:hypothetical protein